MRFISRTDMADELSRQLRDGGDLTEDLHCETFSLHGFRTEAVDILSENASQIFKNLAEID